MKLHKWIIDHKLIMELHDWFWNCMIMVFVLFGICIQKKRNNWTDSLGLVFSCNNVYITQTIRRVENQHILRFGVNVVCQLSAILLRPTCAKVQCKCSLLIVIHFVQAVLFKCSLAIVSHFAQAFM